jgi:plastocyanin
MNAAQTGRQGRGKHFLLFACMVLAPVLASAASVSVRVVDSQGNPVSGTVVELFGVEAAPQDHRYVVDQQQKQFVPHVSVIPSGASVWFPNSDDIRHHVYSFSPARRFELKLYSGTPADPVGFPDTGMVALGCNIHDGMVGFIYVSDAPRYQVSDNRGRVDFDRVSASGPVRLAVRHPWRNEQLPVTRSVSRRELETNTIIEMKIDGLGPDPRKRRAQPDNPFVRENPFAN